MAVYPATAVIRATANTGRAGKCPSHSRAAKPGMATSSRPWLVRDRARKRRMAIESFFKSLVLLYKSGHVVDVFAVVGHAEFARQRVVDQAGALDVPQPGVAGAGAHFCGFDQHAVLVGAAWQQAQDVFAADYGEQPGLEAAVDGGKEIGRAACRERVGVKGG